MAIAMNDYDYYKSMGICPECGKRKAEVGKVHCKQCAAKRNNYQKNHREKANEAWQAFNNRRKVNHLCTICGKKTDNGIYCKDCASIRNARKKIIRMRKKKGTWTGKFWDDATKEKIANRIIEQWINGGIDAIFQ